MSQPSQPRFGLGAHLDLEPAPDADVGPESPFQFPCAFPIKAMGRADSAVEAVVREIVTRHAPDLADDALSTRPSSGGKWVAITVLVQAQSRSQLDAIYQELTAHALIVYVL